MSDTAPNALGRARVGAGYALVVLAMAVGSAAQPRPEPPVRPDFSLDGWRAEPSRLRAVWARDDQLAARYPLDSAGERVLAALAGLGVAEAAAEGRGGRPDAPSPAVTDATQAAVGAATAYWFEHGRDAFMALGVHSMRRAEATFAAAAEAARAARTPLTRWLAAHRDDPVALAVRETSGTFVEHATGWGLLTDDGHFADDAPDLMRIHLRCRWVLLVTEITDYTFLLDREELRALWRWRVEGDRNLPMERRIDAARRLKQDLEPDYPAFRVLGSLYALRGENARSIQNLREALLDAPFDALAARNLEYLLRYSAAGRER